MTSPEGKAPSLYLYNPSRVLPAVFAALVGASLLLHVYQNWSVAYPQSPIISSDTLSHSRYRFWRVTFFICWGGALFTAGWVVRCISSYHPANMPLYIAQTFFIYVAPPVYSAAAYNMVARLMHYLPMHALLNPNRVLIFFVYLGAAVEGMSAAGAAISASAGQDLSQYETSGALLAAGLVLQGVVECCVVVIVATVHVRAARARMLSRNVRTLCITLYGTSTLVVLRCVFRAVGTFERYDKLGCRARANCGPIIGNEWYLYAFELGPMLLFTWWLNLFHPGRYLPRRKEQYLSPDGQTERLGPGWIDRRSGWETFIDPLDLMGILKGEPSHDKYWLRPDEWPVCKDGS
jgi:hypothetical protein